MQFQQSQANAKLTRPCTQDRSWHIQRTAKICPPLHLSPPCCPCDRSLLLTENRKNRQVRKVLHITDFSSEPFHLLAQPVFVARRFKFNGWLAQALFVAREAPFHVKKTFFDALTLWTNVVCKDTIRRNGLCCAPSREHRGTAGFSCILRQCGFPILVAQQLAGQDRYLRT